MIYYRDHGNPNIITPAELFEKAVKELKYDFNLYCEDSYKENEPHWAFDNFRLNGTIADNPSHLFYTQPSWGKYFIDRFGKDKVKLLTYAIDEETYPYIQTEKKYDVGFIGNVADDDGRKEYLDALKAHFNCFISSEVPTSEISKTLAQCKVVFNHIRYEEINIRFFESLASGAQVVSHSPALHMFAKENEHFVTYKTPDEAIQQIWRLLYADRKREKMAIQARKHVIKHHTYRQRAKEVNTFL